MGMIESKDRATSDPGARKEVMKRMEKEGVEYVLFWFTDIEGHLKGGIPERDIEALAPYWTVCPELLSSLLRLGPLRSLQLAHLDSDSLPHSAGEC